MSYKITTMKYILTILLIPLLGLVSFSQTDNSTDLIDLKVQGNLPIELFEDLHITKEELKTYSTLSESKDEKTQTFTPHLERTCVFD